MTRLARPHRPVLRRREGAARRAGRVNARAGRGAGMNNATEWAKALTDADDPNLVTVARCSGPTLLARLIDMTPRPQKHGRPRLRNFPLPRPAGKMPKQPEVARADTPETRSPHEPVPREPERRPPDAIRKNLAAARDSHA